MTTPSLDALLKIAEAATPGPWIAASRPSSVVGWPIVQGGVGRSICNVSVAPPFDHPGNVEFNAFSCANAAHIAAFNPTVAQALVKVAMAAEKIATDKVSNEDGWTDEYVVLWNTLHDQLEALTAALKGSNHG